MTIVAHKQKYHHPNIAQVMGERVMSCEHCIKESRISSRLNRLALQNPTELITGQEDDMLIDSVRELPAFGGYQLLVSAMDVFSRYLFG